MPGARKNAAVQPRKHNRYQLKIPVIFSWQDAKEVPRRAVGLTRDVSLTGAFVLTASPPPLGANIRLKGFVPTIQSAVHAMRIYGQGKVTRVELAKDKEAKGGFEVEGKPFILRGGERYR